MKVVLNKDKLTCEKLFDRVEPRFKNWKQDQLGWLAILNPEQKFVGFIGAYIHNKKEPYTIEVCCALDPIWQHSKVTTYAFMEYVNYFWPKLNKNVTEKITHVKSPINPRNEGSSGLAKSVYKDAVSENIYVPEYYQSISQDKGERVDTLVPISVVLKIAEEYQRQK